MVALGIRCATAARCRSEKDDMHKSRRCCLVMPSFSFFFPDSSFVHEKQVFFSPFSSSPFVNKPKRWTMLRERVEVVLLRRPALATPPRSGRVFRRRRHLRGWGRGEVCKRRSCNPSLRHRTAEVRSIAVNKFQRCHDSDIDAFGPHMQQL